MLDHDTINYGPYSNSQELIKVSLRIHLKFALQFYYFFSTVTLWSQKIKDKQLQFRKGFK